MGGANFDSIGGLGDTASNKGHTMTQLHYPKTFANLK